MGQASRLDRPTPRRPPMFLPQISRPYSTPESSSKKCPREHPMAPLLRKKLVCFYCSQASSRRQDGTVREWLCKNCDAVNYLDQAGQPTFPPALDGSSSPQDAPPIQRPASQSLDPSPFCATCLRNQHLRTEVLANYIPEDLLETDAEYKAYEANYPSYLKEVDERYPQVCAECKPNVLNIMSTRHHAVKADNLRRVMDRSKNRTHGKPLKTDWREFLILIAAFCYWASVGIQLIWNSMGALATQGPEVEMRDEVSSSVIFEYLRTSMWEQRIPRQLPGMCSVLVAPLAGWSLVLGLASLWWNPQLKTKLYWKRARMTGLNDYYKLQIIVNVARFVGWEILQDPDLFGMKSSIHWAIHFIMFALTALTTYKSHRIVKIDTTPQISWKESPESLLSKPRPEASHRSLGSPPTYQPVSQPTYGSVPKPQGFPIHRIISSQPQQNERLRSYTPLTPPAEFDDEDAMEWSPSQPQRNLSISKNSQVYRQSTSNLFGSIDLGGALPTDKAGSLARPTELTEDSLSPSLQSKDAAFRSYAPLAPAKFSSQEDTGLEDIFTSFFSLGTEPGQRRDPPKSPFRGRLDLTIPSKNVSRCVFDLVLLGSCFLSWQKGWFTGHIELTSLGVISIISGQSLYETLTASAPYRSYSNMLVYFAELLVSAVLGQVVRGGAHMTTWDNFGKALLVIMAIQEVVQIYDSVPLSHQQSSSQGTSDNCQQRQRTNASGLSISNVPEALSSNPPNPFSSSQKPYEALSQLAPTSSFDALTFGNAPQPPLAPPKLFTSLSLGSKPPSSSPFFDPHNPPTLASSVHPRGADRQQLLAARSRRGWGGF